MKRRRFLAASAGLLSTTSGCLAAPSATGVRPPTTPTQSPGVTLAEQGVPASICSESVHDVTIPAILDPSFGPDWSVASVPGRYGTLDDDAVVVGREHDGTARAYPLSVLWHHEIVNDAFGPPTLVTYCPICRSGLVAERRVADGATNFLVSGLLWRPPEEFTMASKERGAVFGAALGDVNAEVTNDGNLVMVDEATGSYWSQMLARAICGPRRGETLTILPSTLTTWGEWRGAHPGTDVLLPPPASGTV